MFVPSIACATPIVGSKTSLQQIGFDRPYPVSASLLSTSLLVVFDNRVPDLEVLYQGLAPDTIAYTLDARIDALAVITQLLAETAATQLVIVAHGEPGVVHIGSNPFTIKEIQARSNLLRNWNIEEISLYSCEVAKGELGQSFVAQLSELTGANVAASTTKTGSAELGGDWQLQVQTNRMSVSPVFQAETIAAYEAVLAAGDLDLSFGTGGKVITDFNNDYDEAKDVLVQSDSKLVVVGYTSNSSTGYENFALIRYNSDGTIDTSFGTGGKVTTDFNGSEAYGYSIVQQSDGKLVVAGYAYDSSSGYENFALSRYNSDGTIDTSFGTGGKVITDFNGSASYGYSIVQQSDGKLVVAGLTSDSSDNSDFALSRYNSNGTIDTSFGSNGKVITDFSGSYDDGWSVVQQSDGKLVVAGLTYNSSDHSDFALSRYNSNGTIDISFGSNGKVITDFNGFDDNSYSVIQQSDGKLVVAGYTYNASDNSDFALSRYNSNGTIDTSFGSNGKVITDFNGSSDYGYSVVQQSNGKLVVAGYVFNSSNHSDFALSRYNSNGTIDTSFGSNGKVITDFNGSNNYSYSIAQQSDGKLVVAGTNGDDFAIVRYLSDPVNQAPEKVGTINPQFATEDSPFIFTIPENTFSDPNGDPLTYTATLTDGSALPAWLSFDSNSRTFSGTPLNGNVGLVGVKVTVSDGQQSISDVFQLSIANTNDIPVASNDALTTNENVAITFNASQLLSNDSDVDTGTLLTIASTTAPINGILTDNQNGTYTYTPNANYYGTDSFSYTISDGNGGTSTASVNLTVLQQQANLIYGTARADRLTGTNQIDVIEGRGSNDTLRGLDDNDVLDGGTGNDYLDGGTGNDSMSGGTGNDTYIVDSIGDTTIEAARGGTDTVQASVSYSLEANLEYLTLTGTAALNGRGNALANRITGNNAANSLSGDAGNDTIMGGLGDDILLGDLGNDTMSGGWGNDTYAVDSRSDSVTESANQGTDTVQSSVSYSLRTNLESLVLTGIADIDGTGNSASNSLTGNDGDNSLTGAAGNDTLSGGAGSDKFVFTSSAAFTTATLGNDTITDFIVGTDKLVLDKTPFRALTSAIGSGFSKATEFTVVDNDTVASTSAAKIVYNSSNGKLFYNQNGAAAGLGSGGNFAVLTANPVLTANDFVIRA